MKKIIFNPITPIIAGAANLLFANGNIAAIALGIILIAWGCYEVSSKA